MRPILLASLIGVVIAGPAAARPPYKKAMADYYGPFLPKQLSECSACHVPPKAGEKDDPEDKPHNAFGARLKKAKKELEKAGKKGDIISRLQAIADEDSDGDGAANLVEILSGRNPGEKEDKPSAAELAESAKKLTAFKARVYHRWDPFETVQRPAQPQAAGDWARNPIDAFLAAEHAARGLKPRPEAARPVLVRRVYLDLIGLPPTPEELEHALNDKREDWYERVVDELLASPRYGERWGRHWMDVWRYADWAGYGAEVRESREHIWQWRDWIVEALNEDKAYDRMIVEMLAADEVAPADVKTLRATGFLVRHWYKFNRNTWMENAVEHTSKAFLGFTMNCARCHDHFFDTDVTQKNYYQFRAFFEPYDVRIDRLPGESDLKKLGLPRVFDAKPDAPTFLFVRGNEKSPDKDTAIQPGVPEALGGSPLKIEAISLPRDATAPDKRAWVIKESLDAAAAAVAKTKETLDQARLQAADVVRQLAGSAGLPLLNQVAAGERTFAALALADAEAALAEARYGALVAVVRAEELEDQGKAKADDYQQAAAAANQAQRQVALLEARRNLVVAQQAVAAAPAKTKSDLAKKADAAEKVLAKAEADAKQPPAATFTKRQVVNYPVVSSGRRLALARWIADRQNPLTARVAVNHIWLRHFGSALVPSVFDFGANGQKPTHPALLDWLAVEFMDNGWSMKKLHRLMVTSAAYRMESTGDAANAGIDRDNRYLWRMNSRRMEAELVRDGVLHLSGQLDLTTGGPEVPHQQGLTSRRRSLYMQHAAEKQVEFLSLFDAANVTECYQRSESIIPQQALALANSTLVLSQSRLLAGKLSKQSGEDNAAFVIAAFRTVLGRAASDQEQAECVKFLTEQAALLAEKKLTPFGGAAAAPVPPSPVPLQRAREGLVHVLMNHNDFVTIR